MSYSVSPAASSAYLKPSAAFKKEVARVSVAIFLFIVLYMVMLAAGLALAAILGYGGIMVIINVHNLMAILFGAGLIGVGVMVSFFLVKFVFATGSAASDNAFEIKEGDYPELFDLVREVSESVNTSFPKRIFLTGDVNAYVSYDSNIKALLFPVKKNLTIGLGLVNMTNKGEFRAVLAHEFGHFAQGSMRAGSYVYQVNKVIYNLLYENSGYYRTLQSWAEIHSTFALCANITAKIVGAIQWVLQQAYKEINKSYMSLSRQMEFHADAIAANCAGGNNLVSSLRRLEFADVSWQYTMDKYNVLLKEGFKATNMFTQHRISSSYIAKLNKLEEVQGLPTVSKLDEMVMSYRRVNVEDQWASHPTRQQREAALADLGINGPVDGSDPWELFGTTREALQQQFTEQIYAGVRFEAEVQPLDDGLYRQRMDADIASGNYPEAYAGFYDGRVIARLDLQSIEGRELTDTAAFFKSGRELFKRLQSLKEDIQLLDTVGDKKSGIRYFDLDGEKLHAREATTVQHTLRQQLAEGEAQLAANDAAVAAHFKALAAKAGKEGDYVRLFGELYTIDELTIPLKQGAETVLEHLQRPYNGQHTIEGARGLSTTAGEQVRKLRSALEKAIPQLQALSLLPDNILRDDIRGYQALALNFFSGEQFNNEAIQEVWTGTLGVIDWCYDLQFQGQKRLAEYQLELDSEYSTAGGKINDLVPG